MAMNVLGCDYNSGRCGLTVDYSKANQLFQRAIDLGCGVAHYNLGNSYYQGRGIEQNMKKTKHHWQMAAIMGDVINLDWLRQMGAASICDLVLDDCHKNSSNQRHQSISVKE